MYWFSCTVADYSTHYKINHVCACAARPLTFNFKKNQRVRAVGASTAASRGPARYARHARRDREPAARGSVRRRVRDAQRGRPD